MPKRKLILAIDDNAINRIFVESALKDIPAEVVICESGEAAVDAASQRDYDLLLIDIRMPGIDGYETLKRIKELPNKSHRAIAIALTAEPEEFQGNRLNQSTFNTFLTKPISKINLVDHVCQSLDICQKDSSETVKSNTMSTTLTAIDIEKALLVSGGNKTLVANLLTMLKKEVPTRIMAIEELISSHQFSEADNEIHTFLGSLAYCGVRKLPETLIVLQSAMRDKDSTELLRLAIKDAEELQEAITHVIPNLKEI